MGTILLVETEPRGREKAVLTEQDRVPPRDFGLLWSKLVTEGLLLESDIMFDRAF